MSSRVERDMEKQGIDVRASQPSDDVKPYTREELALEALTLSAIHRGFVNAGHHQTAEKFLRLCATAKQGVEDRERLDWIDKWAAQIDLIDGGVEVIRYVNENGDDFYVEEQPNIRAAIDAVRSKTSPPCKNCGEHYSLHSAYGYCLAGPIGEDATTYQPDRRPESSGRASKADFKPTLDDVVQFPDGHLEDVVSVDVESLLDLVTTTRHRDPFPVHLHDEANGITRILRTSAEDYE